MSRKCIGTYAFFDLETTGLPDFEFNKTKITEICFVACSKDSILNTEKDKLPRVLHKLSFCVNPFKLISPESTRITGLDNFLLEKENKFDENSVTLLNHFLLQLDQPVCLVAHNGDKFDFPIIQKQLTALKSTLPDDLRCVDSLPFFQSLEDHLPQEVLDEPKKLFAEPTDLTNEVRLEKTLIENDVVAPSNGTTIDQPSASTHFDEDNVIIALFDEDHVKQQQKLNESTPSNRKTVAKQELHSKKSVLYGSKSITPPPSKRKLLFSSFVREESSFIPSKRMKFTLSTIYKRFFGTEPTQTHYAESDTLMLLNCAIASKTKFIEYAEENAIFFKDIKSLGS